MPLLIQCPSCTRSLRVPDNLLGQLVKCPTCEAQFTATEGPARPSPTGHGKAESAPAPPAAAWTEQPAPPRRAAPVEYDFRDLVDDRDDDYYGHEPRRPGRTAARAAVSGPAIGLMVVGSLALGISILSIILNLAGAALAERQLGGPVAVRRAAPDVTIKAVTGVIGAIVGLCWGGVVLSGALALKNLKSHGYAMTGAIVAMLPCNGCCLLGLPFGIWALVVLSRSEVKEAFTR